MIYSCSVVGPDASDYSDLCTGFDGTLATNNLALTASYSDLDVVGGDLPAGDYTFTITATTQYGATETADFLWVLSDPCFSLTTFAPEEQGDLADNFSGTPMTFVLTPFDVVRTDCADRIVYDCTSVEDPDGMAADSLCQSIADLVNNDLILTATEDNYFDEDLIPGTYIFTITATDPASNTVTTTFDWVLTSPCDPPTSLADTV